MAVRDPLHSPCTMCYVYMAQKGFPPYYNISHGKRVLGKILVGLGGGGWELVFSTHFNFSYSYYDFCMLLSFIQPAYVHKFSERNHHISS